MRPKSLFVCALIGCLPLSIIRSEAASTTNHKMLTGNCFMHRTYKEGRLAVSVLLCFRSRGKLDGAYVEEGLHGGDFSGSWSGKSILIQGEKCSSLLSLSHQGPLSLEIKSCSGIYWIEGVYDWRGHNEGRTLSEKQGPISWVLTASMTWVMIDISIQRAE
jgi:hypothetical protein